MSYNKNMYYRTYHQDLNKHVCTVKSFLVQQEPDTRIMQLTLALIPDNL